MSTRFLATFGDAAPPEGLSPPLEALWWLRKGNLAVGPEWERAHRICQSGEGSPDYDAIHALVHWIEGDRANADYWYGRAGRRPEGADVAGEWAHLVSALGD